MSDARTSLGLPRTRRTSRAVVRAAARRVIGLPAAARRFRWRTERRMMAGTVLTSGRVRGCRRSIRVSTAVPRRRSGSRALSARRSRGESTVTTAAPAIASASPSPEALDAASAIISASASCSLAGRVAISLSASASPSNSASPSSSNSNSSSLSNSNSLFQTRPRRGR